MTVKAEKSSFSYLFWATSYILRHNSHMFSGVAKKDFIVRSLSVQFNFKDQFKLKCQFQQKLLLVDFLQHIRLLFSQNN